MKIRTKLIIGFAIVASLIWVVVFVATNTYTLIHDEFEVLKGDVVPGAIAMSKMAEKAQETRAWTLTYVMRGNVVRNGKPVKEWLQETTTSLEELAREHREAAAAVPEEAEVAKEVGNKVNQLSLAVTEIVNLKDQGVGADELMVKLEESIQPIFMPLILQFEEHQAEHMEELAAAEEAVHQAHIYGEQSLILAGGFITLAAIAVAFLITRMITNPLYALRKGTEIIGGGNLDYKVGTPAKDEIGQLSRAFDQMTKDLKGTTTSIDSLNKEITERKLAEETLKEARDSYEALVNNIPEAIYSCLPDKNAPVLYISDRFGEWTGYYPDDFYRDEKTWPNCIHPEDRDRAVAGFTEAFSNNKELDIEYRVVHKDTGQVRYVRDHAAPVFDGDGSVHHYDGILSDVTERKQAEDALRIKDRALASSISAIAITDLETNLTYVNSSFLELWGYDNESEVLGRPIPEFSQIGEDVTVAMEALSKGGGWIGQSVGKRKDGSPFDIQLATSLVKDKAGKPIRTMASFVDITERKLAEEKIKASLAEKELLLKEVHHRVKNNMQVISSLLKLGAGAVKNKEDAVVFKDSQDRIKSMALVYNKLYQAEDLAHIDFGEYVRDLIRNLVPSYKAVSGKVTTSVEGGGVSLGVVQAIPCGLIINELLTNSLKYAFPKGRGGEIRVSIGESEGEVELMVSDDGVGIPASLDLADSKTLGLHLVGNLVEQLGGKIELDRTAGTRFRITFRKNQE